jgi:uncharacterized membrane protein
MVAIHRFFSFGVFVDTKKTFMRTVIFELKYTLLSIVDIIIVFYDLGNRKKYAYKQ